MEMKGNGVEAITKVQDLYKSCLDTSTTNSLGMLPLLDVLERVGKYCDVKCIFHCPKRAFLLRL